MSSIRYYALSLACIIATACGSEEVIHEKSPRPQDEPECLNCGSDYNPNEDIEIPEPRPRVYLFPTELLFYFTNNTEYPYSPGYISVVNKSGRNVIIIDAIILEDEECYICEGSDHFILSDPELPQVLEHGESLQLEISFLFSTRQQGAILEVYTTFEPDTILRAGLSGKVFIW